MRENLMVEAYGKFLGDWKDRVASSRDEAALSANKRKKNDEQ
jgi:hypothetical protein